jgi:hypothetical protein
VAYYYQLFAAYFILYSLCASCFITKTIRRSYYVKEDTSIFDYESDYLDDEDDECLFMALNIGTNSTNSERCMNESDLKIVHNVEGTMVINFHARKEKSYWTIVSECSNHMIGDKSKFVKLEKYE